MLNQTTLTNVDGFKHLIAFRATDAVRAKIRRIMDAYHCTESAAIRACIEAVELEQDAQTRGVTGN